MKSKKQIALVLPALLTFGLLITSMTGCDKNKPSSSAADTSSTAPITEVSLSVTPKKATIYLNDESNTFQLNAKLENGEGKTLVWTSNDQTVATVSETGLVTGLKLGEATITVATNDGAVSDTAVITVKQDRSQEDTLNSLQKPSFLINYENKTATLDDVSTIQTNKDPSRASYYKNEQGTRDIYKVGNQNAFKAQISGLAIDPVTLEDEVFANPFTTVKVELFNKTSNKYEVINDDQLSAHVAINEAHNSYQFTNDAAGNQYKITVSPDATKYAEVSEYCSPVVMEIAVFDGFNVYNKDELSVVDNWQAAWAEKKAAIGVADVEAKGVALHSNLTIGNDDIPASFKYTAQDIENYITNFPTNWEDYVSKKKNNRPTEAERTSFDSDKAKEFLTDSVKDWTTVYLHKTSGEDNFYFEGNYNTVDFSGIKQIFAFGGNPLGSGKLSENYFPNNNGSHGQLFGFNTELENNPPVIGGGQNFIKNVNIIGNGNRSSDDNYEGGLISYKVRSTDVYFQNVISSKTFITFLMEKDSDEREDAVHVPTRTYMDRCKSFDSYNSMLYIWGTEDNIITNSVMNGAGGAIVLLDDVGAHNANSKNQGIPKVDAFNVHFENLLTGQEPWFVNHTATELVTMMEGFGTSQAWFGRNAAAHGEHMNISTENTEHIPFIDLIAIDICGENPLGCSLSKGGRPLKGHFNIYNDANMSQLVAGLDMSLMAAADPRDGQQAFVGAVLSEYGKGNVLPLYRMMAQNASSAGMVVATSAGGHGMLYDETFTNGVVAQLNYPNYDQLPLAPYAIPIPGTQYEVDPFPFYGPTDPTNPDGDKLGAEYAYNLGLQDNMNKLASGNYLSFYFQAPITDDKGQTVDITEYLGAFIQMHQIGA